MKTKILYFTCCITTLLLISCSTQQTDGQNVDYIATIQPIKYIVEQITGDDFVIDVLVPTGASPETFEPTPKQFIALNEAKFIFSTGLIDFENALVNRAHNQQSVVNLSKGIELIKGSCSHKHHHDNAHLHGVDPHIWTSPRELKIMAQNAYSAIIAEYPDSTKYTEAFNTFSKQLDALDAECASLCSNSSAEAFVVYHPALTYFSRAYGIEQISIENDGKEPSAKHLATIIELSQEKNVRCLLYQTQYPRSAVEILAKDMNIECHVFDPLAEDVINNIHNITCIITGNDIRLWDSDKK